MMTIGNSKKRDKPTWLMIGIPPMLFLAKDLIATIIVLSYEPGITKRAVTNYVVQLLPGTLFVETGRAIPLNVGFGFVVGGLLYLTALYRWYSQQRRGA